ncbi:putative short-chain dehydrogenase [Hypoxylon argillaceum]|nr:putative short-chain dehydrogenase [Hypoxylon argillaceum]
MFNLIEGTIILTGANGGLGSAIARQIASHQQFAGYHNLYAVHAAASTSDLHKAIQPECSSHPHDVVSLNLADLDNIRDLAKTINTRVSEGQLPPIRALILNAVFQDFGNQQWTGSFDTTFIANYLGHWLLTLLLLKSIDKSSAVPHSTSHDKRNEQTGAFDEEKYKTVIIYPIVALSVPNGLVRSSSKLATQVLNAAFDSDSELTTLPKTGYYFDGKPFETSVDSRNAQRRDVVWKEGVKCARLKGDETILCDWA